MVLCVMPTTMQRLVRQEFNLENCLLATIPLPLSDQLRCFSLFGFFSFCFPFWNLNQLAIIPLLFLDKLRRVFKDSKPIDISVEHSAMQ